MEFTWELSFRELKGPIFALNDAEVKEVGLLSLQEVIYLNFSLQLDTAVTDQKCISKMLTKHRPSRHTHTRTNSTQPQAKFFQCQLQLQNDKTWWLYSREHLLLPKKSHKAAGGICFFPCGKKSVPCASIT